MPLMIPAAVKGALALYGPKLLKMLGVGVKGSKAAAKSGFVDKHFLEMLIGGTYAGSTVLGEWGAAGERGISREQIALQKLLGTQQAAATKRSVTEDRKRAKEYMNKLLEMRVAEKKEAREATMLQSFTQSQDRQMALVLQAMQGIAQTSRPSSRGGGGMVNLMRSAL